LYDPGFLVKNPVRYFLTMLRQQNQWNIECDQCGACCRTYPVLVSIGDAKREPRIAEFGLQLPEWQQTDEWHYKLHPLPFLEACPFLAEDATCSTYETRPDPCRRFQAGSEECNEARHRIGLDAL
jgi:Fe-S-cluster containining protein